jgi:hypothetical protein
VEGSVIEDQTILFKKLGNFHLIFLNINADFLQEIDEVMVRDETEVSLIVL